jgi:hypothetical protein
MPVVRTVRHHGSVPCCSIVGQPRPFDLADAKLALALLGGIQVERKRSEDT